LRMVAGLESISEGDIMIGNKVVNQLPPMDRDIAMVFQNYALYPHMSVYDNMAFGLKMRKFDKAEIAKRVNNAAEILDIKNHLGRKPRMLSGGQRQRVALGRAIVRNPQVFLFDEPLSNLDAALRGQTRIEIAKLHRDLDATTIYVTHDQVEAMTLADRIVIMRDGVVQQVGSPLEIFDRPANVYVASFIGSPEMNLLDLRRAGGTLAGSNCTVEAPPGLAAAPDAALKVGIRPDHVVVLPASEAGSASGWLDVDVCEQLGTTTLMIGGFDGQRLRVLTPRSNARPGDRLAVRLPADRLHLFDDDSGERIA